MINYLRSQLKDIADNKAKSKSKSKRRLYRIEESILRDKLNEYYNNTNKL